jgi:hypothetical protein
MQLRIARNVVLCGCGGLRCSEFLNYTSRFVEPGRLLKLPRKKWLA